VKQSLERLAMTETTFLVQAHLYLVLIFPRFHRDFFSKHRLGKNVDLSTKISTIESLINAKTEERVEIKFQDRSIMEKLDWIYSTINSNRISSNNDLKNIEERLDIIYEDIEGSKVRKTPKYIEIDHERMEEELAKIRTKKKR
jgi:hypothetical protein